MRAPNAMRCDAMYSASVESVCCVPHEMCVQPPRAVVYLLVIDGGAWVGCVDFGCMVLKILGLFCAGLLWVVEVCSFVGYAWETRWRRACTTRVLSYDWNTAKCVMGTPRGDSLKAGTLRSRGFFRYYIDTYDTMKPTVKNLTNGVTSHTSTVPVIGNPNAGNQIH